MAGIEVKFVLRRDVQHAQMDHGIFVAREPTYRTFPSCFAAITASGAPSSAK